MSAAAAGVSASAFAAVTASSSLQHFSLKVWDYPQPPEQLQIWQHMFPAGHTLPHLTSLVLECRVPPVSHLQLMVQCCPALCRLHLSSASQAEAWMHLGALQSLRRLTSLQVTHYVWRDEGLALLTGLQELRLFDSSLTDAATAQLTSLQQLTDLYIDSASFCFMYGPDNKMLKGRHRNVLKLDLSRVVSASSGWGACVMLCALVCAVAKAGVHDRGPLAPRVYSAVASSTQ